MKRGSFWVLLLLLFILALAVSALAVEDVYEPDDSSNNATTIATNGSFQSHSLYPSGDLDFFNFSTTAGAFYLIKAINLSQPNLTDTEIILYDADGNTLLAFDDASSLNYYHSSRIIWRAPSAGNYYFSVSELDNDEGGSYNVSVERIGTLSPYLLDPVSWSTVAKHKTFNFTAGVTCTGGPCYNVAAILDPEQTESEGFYDSSINLSDELLSKVDEEVFSSLEEDGEVRVIVRLKEPSQEALNSDSSSSDISSSGNFKKFKGYKKSLKPAAEERRQRLKKLITENQDRVLENIDVEDDFKLKHRYSTTAAFSGVVSEEGLEKLVSAPDVEFIYPVKTAHISLHQSVPLIAADTVHNIQLGSINVTGSSYTVCVLDTGINYNHEDFGGSGFPNARIIGGYDYVNNDADPFDDHGHGSHVSGIIASQDSTYKGVAPGSNIVMLKVCDSSGSCLSDDINAGLEWCVDNASAYNVSAISISLGGLYDSNSFGCDDIDSTTTQLINSARGLGIPVFIASGNEYRSVLSSPGISWPACVYNATSVGSTTKANAVSSFTNRDNNLDLLAPGSTIFSTLYSSVNGHVSKSGTSMSAPHAAGAAVLVKQFFSINYNRTLTAKEIELILKFNGFNILDSSTSLVFPRLDVYSAVTSKGAVSTSPGAVPFYTTTSNPHDSSCLADMSDGESCNVSWSVNATGALQNYTFFVIFETEYTNNITSKINITIINNIPALSSPNVEPSSGNTSNIFNFSVNYSDFDSHPPLFVYVFINNVSYTLARLNAAAHDYSDGNIYYYTTYLRPGNYSYYFSASDGFNSTSTSLAYAPNVTDVASPSLSLSSPANAANVSSALQSFSFNVNDDFADSINCSLIFDGTVVNSTRVTNNLSGTINYLIPTIGTHSWSVSCSDGANINSSFSRSITYDSISPVVVISSPANRTVLLVNVSDFVFIVTDNFFSSFSCKLYVGGTVYGSNNSVLNNTSTVFGSIILNSGSLSWLVNCTDSASNYGSSALRNIVVPTVNATRVVNASANTPLEISVTESVIVNISTSQSVTGTLSAAQYTANPEATEPTSSNGFADLSINNFISLNASDDVAGNLSWYLLNIYYADSELPDDLDESSLRIYYFNTTSAQWEQEPDSGVDTAANRVWANITHFSTFSPGGSTEDNNDNNNNPPSSGGGGGGGGGGATASDNALVVTPAYSTSVIETPKNQKFNIIYEGKEYSFKVVDFTDSILTIKSLPALITTKLANGMNNGFDLDGDDRFDVRLGYSGKRSQKALIFLYLVNKPSTISLLPPAPRKPREETKSAVSVIEQNVSVVEGSLEETVSPAIAVSASDAKDAELEKPQNISTFRTNRSLFQLIILAVLILFIIIVSVLLVLEILKRRKIKLANQQNSVSQQKSISTPEQPVALEKVISEKKQPNKKANNPRNKEK